MSDVDYFTGSHKPVDFVRSLRHDLRFYRRNPFYFDPCGCWVFVGSQGSGKTLSAVRTLRALLAAYPGANVCSNLNINGLDRPVIPFTDYSQITDLSNGIFGMIYLIDEIHVLWNSLESKKIPFEEMAVFAQMRKERRIILGTSQVYGRIAKPIREQLKYVIKCRSYLKYIQVNEIIDPNADGYNSEDDGHFQGELISRQWFFHTPEDYDSYSTFDRIRRIER